MKTPKNTIIENLTKACFTFLLLFGMNPNPNPYSMWCSCGKASRTHKHTLVQHCKKAPPDQVCKYFFYTSMSKNPFKNEISKVPSLYERVFDNFKHAKIDNIYFIFFTLIIMAILVFSFFSTLPYN